MAAWFSGRIVAQPSHWHQSLLYGWVSAAVLSRSGTPGQIFGIVELNDLLTVVGENPDLGDRKSL